KKQQGKKTEKWCMKMLFVQDCRIHIDGLLDGGWNSRIDSQTSVYLSRDKEFLEILIGLVGVCVTGVFMYYISTLFTKNEKDDQHDMKLLPQIFGWCSAIFYFGARVPQIIQNYKSQSTKGLSLA
ncbi:20433_t:CDS:2, partial [Cetraspora pellucida]